jgi:hypothetical protein
MQIPFAWKDTLKSRRLRADYIVVATGSRPAFDGGEDTKRNFMHAKRQSSSETTHVVQATIGYLR